MEHNLTEIELKEFIQELKDLNLRRPSLLDFNNKEFKTSLLIDLTTNPNIEVNENILKVYKYYLKVYKDYKQLTVLKKK